jgi:hypothetical protein
MWLIASTRIRKEVEQMAPSRHIPSLIDSARRLLMMWVRM